MHTTTSEPIVPVYRALSIAGNVLDRDELGRVYHTTVSDTTLEVDVEVVFEVR
ncbi:MAG: hypothetical protein R2810_07025 [Flavobacteriales bacterium]|nr:hypothetical protein [Flavobacteriales bacterium]MCB0808799.1 hypothetical protein [Flavobacteriales bacterium]MCB0811694.1 hypothetical protein [Flavobacteriales bacterium]MCB0817021.1 hypothetical protein [Flavobacteriales bacterium]MCB9182019.1 hypothetical protein [Flavobacteriales bacterium]